MTLQPWSTLGGSLLSRGDSKWERSELKGIFKLNLCTLSTVLNWLTI